MPTKSLALTLAVFAAALVAAELVTQAKDPREVFGWGEKSSLEADPDFGWRLKPDKVTRLRWLGYDYRVTSSHLGFPAPAYPGRKPPGTYRVLTVGGGFTSAEGVDTAQAWPRLLEAVLNDRSKGMSFQVMNFAVTGYGPPQYVAVLDEFAPEYRPDLIIVALSVGDLGKALSDPQKRRKALGLDRPATFGLTATLTLAHFSRWLAGHAKEFVFENLLRRQSNRGYFFGQLALFETGEEAFYERAGAALGAQLEEIRQISEATQSRLLLTLIPASVQVCRPDQLDYLSRHLDLTDGERFDLDQPQRAIEEIARDLRLQVADLRSALAYGAEPCPYHPRNLHWTETGHRTVAEFLAERLTAMPGLLTSTQE